MLSEIREKTQGIIATFILVMVTIPFALWGINSYFETGPNLAVAKVNGNTISQQSYRSALDQLRSADMRQADGRALRELVLEGLIAQMLLTDDAHDHGYRVSDERLARIIREAPYFQRDGRFDGQLYEGLLRREGTTAHDFEARLRRENLTGQVQRGLSESAFVTSADITAVVRLLQQERRISYVLISPDSFRSQVNVTAEDVEQHYTAHADAYQIPEQVRVEYLRLSLADSLTQYQPRDEELRDVYNAETARYVTPAKRRVSHILIQLPAGASDADDKKAQARIAEVERQARAGSDFGALARKQSEDRDSAAKGGDLGEVTRGLLPAELEAAINVLKPGEVSKPVRTPYGYHLAKLTGYVPEKRVSFEAARKELIDAVRKRKGEERFFELAERFRNLVYENPESLEPAARELGLAIQRSNWFARSGGDGIAAQPRVLEAAFDPELRSARRNSEAIEVGNDALVALRVVDYRPATTKPLAEVRTQVERALKEERVRQRVETVSAEWLEKLKQGSTLADLAKRAGVALPPPQTLTREQAGRLDRRIVDAAFGTPRPTAGPAYARADMGVQGYAVVAVESVRDGDPATADAAVKEKVRRQLMTRRGADYYANYRTGLRRDADVKVYPDQL